MSEKITIRNGGLYKGDVKLQLEFGNLEQIKALREYEYRMAAFSEDGLELDPYYETDVTAHASFRCLCGFSIDISVSADDDEDVDCFHSITKKCIKCSKSYVMKSEEGSLYVFFKKDIGTQKNETIF